MSANDKFSEVGKLRQQAQDKSLTVELRLEKVKELLKLLPSGNNIKKAKTYCNELASIVGVSEETKKKIAKELKKIKDGHYTNAEPDDRSDTEDAPVFNVVENLKLGTTPEEALAKRNKDARAIPMPSKFVYFPRGQREYLVKHYADLYAPFGFTKAVEIHESFFDDAYNELPESGSRFQRSLNPLWLKTYVEWKENKFGAATLPDRTSIYFLRFCHEEEVRRWNKLRTLLVPEEQPVGAELRRRQLASGEVQRWETPFLWNLWWAIGLNRTDYVTSADTPIQFLTEFPGIEKKARVLSADAQGVSAKVIPAAIQPEQSLNATVNAELGPRYGLPKEVCGYCRGLPKSEVPPHDCLSYMIPEDAANFMDARSGPAIRRVSPLVDNSAENERIKARIRHQGYGDAIEGDRVWFDNRKITFAQWAKENPE